jgi:Domain of unknown function (DUF4157)
MVSERANKREAKAPASKRDNAAAGIRKAEPVRSCTSPYAQVIHLQETLGNQAVQGLFRAGIIQARLRIGQPHDIYEQEADRVADAVMRMPQPVDGKSQFVATVQASRIGLNLSVNVGEALRRQMKQPFYVEEGLVEGDLLQTKAIPGHIPGMRTGLPPSRIERLRRTGGLNLPPSVRDFMESRFDRDFAEVRLHADSNAAETAKGMNALAFTVGRDIVFGEGQFMPTTGTGMRLLAHELAHVIQQGEVPPTLQKTHAIRSHDHPPLKNEVSARGSASTTSGRKSPPYITASSRDSDIIRRVRWNPNTDTGKDSYPWRTGPHGDVLTAATDAGTPIEIWRPHDGTTYWCHGFTFAGSTARGGPYSLWGSEVPTVLHDDGWRPVDSCVARGGDILIFYDQSGHEVHSGIIRDISAQGGYVDEAASTLESKWGMLPLGVASWLTNAAAYGKYRCFSKRRLYGPCITAGTNEMTRDRQECPAYEHGEVGASHTSKGLLDPDVRMVGPGQLLIADFGVGWQGVKGSTRMEPLMQSWLRTFESDSSYRLRIFGYGDCSGPNRTNEGIRRGRAKEVERILGPRARLRVVLSDMAALGVYITSNDSARDRATNRAVVIEFHQEP